MTTLEVTLSPEQLADLADLIVARLPRADAPAPLKLGYTIPEAVERTSCKDSAIRAAITSGELIAKRNGRGAYVIHHAALDNWLRGVPNTTLPATGVRQRKAR